MLDFNRLSNKLKTKGIANSNELGHALLDHHHHIVTVTGDSILVSPNTFAARIVFVDCDGERGSVVKHAAHMLKGIEALKNFVSYIQE